MFEGTDDIEKCDVCRVLAEKYYFEVLFSIYSLCSISLLSASLNLSLSHTMLFVSPTALHQPLFLLTLAIPGAPSLRAPLLFATLNGPGTAPIAKLLLDAGANCQVGISKKIGIHRQRGNLIRLIGVYSLLNGAQVALTKNYSYN